VAFPECSLRAKRTWGLESKLESLTGFGLQIRSPWVHVPPVEMFQRTRRSCYIWVASDEGPHRQLTAAVYADPQRCDRLQGRCGSAVSASGSAGGGPSLLNPEPLGRVTFEARSGARATCLLRCAGCAPRVRSPAQRSWPALVHR
jgi:hypothetical protein